MKIELINKDVHAEIERFYTDNPNIVYQNTGYDYPDHSKFTEADKAAFDRVSEVLRKHIYGFTKLHNLRLDKKGRKQLRFNYRWDESFTGVGYILLDELLNGFES